MNIGLLRFISIDHLALIAYCAAGIGLCLFLRGFQLFARKHSLGHIPAPTIRSASPGPAAISGIATGPNTLSAPITGQTCYLYRTTVWQQNKSGRKQEWEKVAEETLHRPFFIEDATGQLLVEPLGADLNLDQGFRQEYGAVSASFLPQDIPLRVSVFLARHGIALRRPTRIEECSIQPNTPVFIAGTLAENPGIQVSPHFPCVNDSPRDSLSNGTNGNSAEGAPRPEVIRLSNGAVPSSTKHMTQQGKIAAALNRAGVTKPEERALADTAFPEVFPQGVAVEDGSQPNADSTPEAAAAAANNRGNGQTKPDNGFGFNPGPPLVLMKGADNAAFAISSSSQPELVSSFGWKPVAMVVGGAGLTVLGLCVLLLERQMR